MELLNYKLNIFEKAIDIPTLKCYNALAIKVSEAPKDFSGNPTGDEAERCRWQEERGEGVAAVEKYEGEAKRRRIFREPQQEERLRSTP